MFNGKIHYKWSFSIAMLNYQRVNVNQRNKLTVLTFDNFLAKVDHCSIPTCPGHCGAYYPTSDSHEESWPAKWLRPFLSSSRPRARSKLEGLTKEQLHGVPGGKKKLKDAVMTDIAIEHGHL